MSTHRRTSPRRSFADWLDHYVSLPLAWAGYILIVVLLSFLIHDLVTGLIP